jgi:hypothetical protein
MTPIRALLTAGGLTVALVAGVLGIGAQMGAFGFDRTPDTPAAFGGPVLDAAANATAAGAVEQRTTQRLDQDRSRRNQDERKRDGGRRDEQHDDED